MAKKWIRLILDCAKDWPWIGADLVLWRKFRPPRRLGTIPYRALVPRLLRQMALSNGLKLALDCSRIGDTYANAVPIHLEVWLWAGIDYGVSLVQFILREDQLATRIEACSIG